MQTSVLTKHLKAALCCAATKDIRYYLNGLYVEVMATETRIVGCDGGTVAVLRLLQDNPDCFTVIIPIDIVKLAISGKSEVLSLSHVDGKWVIGAIGFTAVEGKFPDYRRVIPNNHNGQAAQFSTDLIAQFAKIGKALGHKGNPIIRHNGYDAAQVQFYGDNDFVGVIMPLNAFTSKNPDQGLITWGSK